ncbi:MAG TPA: DUF2914 domain-containing protein, partial [Burkholderiales bacterium]
CARHAGAGNMPCRTAMDPTARRKFIMRRILALSTTLALLLPTLACADATVTEARLGRRIADREVAEATSTFAPGERAYLWMKVRGAAGELVTVTWQINGQTYPTELKIGGDPWRTWASKTLHIAGEWTVTVTDAGGTTLHESRLSVK